MFSRFKWCLAVLLLFHTLESSAALISAETYLEGKGQNYLQRLANLINRLNDDFNLVCNDSYCHGIYDLYKPLTIHCFVESTTGITQYCVWSIAKSLSWVTRDDKVANDGQVYFCEFKPKVKIESLIESIEHSRAGGATPYLSANLPDSGVSLAQTLAACLK